MEESCKNCEEKKACIPFFVAENQMMHADITNKRMLIALLAVCVTFILTIIIFVTGYTRREKNWLDTIAGMNHSTAYTEVAADGGIHEQQDP